MMSNRDHNLIADQLIINLTGLSALVIPTQVPSGLRQCATELVLGIVRVRGWCGYLIRLDVLVGVFGALPLQQPEQIHK